MESDMNYRILSTIALCTAMALPAVAQKSGQNVTITFGVVRQIEQVTLQSEGGGKGAAIGGTLGYASGSSKSKSRRNALIGGAAGAALSSSGKSEGMQYTVQTSDGSAIIVVSDQTEIQMGDCVSVEQSGDRANIRRQDDLACDPSSAAAVAAVEDELIENANECAIAKQQLLDAKTQEELEIATAKAHILCD